jgi:hypothetical protein
MTKIKFTCGIPTQAECVSTEVTPNEESSLTEESCLSQEQVNKDVFAQLEKIWSQLNLEDLGEECLTYTLEETKIVVKNALLKHEEEICLLKEELETLQNRKICDTPISECVETFSCLEGECDNSIVTLGDWMTAVQTRICAP